MQHLDQEEHAMLMNRNEAEGSVFERLTAEHRAIETMLDAVLTTAEERRGAELHRLAALIRAHARAEDEIVFPALDGSHELGHHVRKDHADHLEIDRLLQTIEALQPTSPTWLHWVRTLDAVARRHFQDEESVVFPRARFVISSQHAAELLALYERDRDLTLPAARRS